MKLPDQKIEQCVSKDAYRYHLQGVAVLPGYLMATDGHILVALPHDTHGAVDQDDETASAIVPLAAFKAARKKGAAGGLGEVLIPDAETMINRGQGMPTADVPTKDGGMVSFPLIDGTPPAWRTVMKDVPAPGDAGTVSFCVNAELLARLQLALCGGKHKGVQITVTVDEPTRVLGVLPAFDEDVASGVQGACMPLRAK